MMKRSHRIVALLACGLLAQVGSARVFRAIDGRAGHLNATGLGWTAAYQTTMRVDGVRNELQVYAAHTDAPIMDQLKEQFQRQGATVTIAQTPAGIQGIARWEDREARILVLPPMDNPNRLVFLFYPEPGEKAVPVQLPVPEYPGTLQEKTVQNEGSGTIYQTLTTEDPPDQVQAFYAERLSAAGWHTVIPPGQGQKRMAIYQKGEQVCSILSAFNPDGVNTVTLLVKGVGL